MCVESRFGQASVKKKANTLPNQNTEFDKKKKRFKTKTEARKAAWVNMGLKRHRRHSAKISLLTSWARHISLATPSAPFKLVERINSLTIAKFSQ